MKNMSDKFCASILQEPDFIFKDKENTALVCKEFKLTISM